MRMIFQTKRRFDERGIGLIETLLALGVAVIIVTSMVSLAIFTLRASLQNKLLLSGTQLASQEVELVRAYRDGRTWTEFLADVDGTNGIDCFASSCYMSNAGTLNVASGELILAEGTTEETRKSFGLIDVNGDKSLIRVAVTVSWTIGSDTRFAHNYTELSDWRGL